MPQVQVLPYVPSFGERLADTIGQGLGNIGSSYFQGKKAEQINAKDQDIINQLGAPNLSPLQAITLVSKLSPQKQQSVSNMLGPLLKEQAKHGYKNQFYQDILSRVHGGNAAVASSSPLQNLIQESNPNANAPIAQTPMQAPTISDQELQSWMVIPELKDLAKSIIDERHRQEDITRKDFIENRSFHQKGAEKAIEEEGKLRRSVRSKEGALQLAREAIESGETGPLSWANVANRLNIPELMSQGGDELATAAFPP